MRERRVRCRQGGDSLESGLMERVDEMERRRRTSAGAGGSGLDAGGEHRRKRCSEWSSECGHNQAITAYEVNERVGVTGR